MMIVRVLLTLALALSVVVEVAGKRERFTSTKAMRSKVPDALKAACRGQLEQARTLVAQENSAGALHILSSIFLLLDADTEGAVFVHELGREKDPKLLPPLAKMYMEGETCNGLGDLFYVLAVTIKKLKDTKVSHSAEFEAHTTLVTLLSDSGLYDAAELHLAKAKKLEPNRAELKIRGALMTPGVYSSLQHINETRAMLEERLDDLVEDEDFELVKLNEFAMSPTFYLIYQGLSDVKFLTALHDTYARGHPSLHAYPSTDKLPPFPPVRVAKATSDDKSVGVDSNSGSALVESASAPSQPLRVGFVSSHFRRHSICKLFCGVIQDLAKTTHTSVNNKNTSFQVYVFSGQDESREDKYTKQLKDSVHLFVRLSRFTVPARQEVLKRQIDVLIYLDIGMDPSTTVWGASKLAPIQMCIWGHPSTTGLRSMDYYISSELFHRDLSPQYRRTEEIFLEQVVRLPSTLGIAFERPLLSLSSPVTDEDLIHRPTDFLNAVNDTLGNAKPANITLSPFGAPATIATLVDKKARGEVLILIPQHLPKFHPDFDVVIRDLLESVPDASVVITYDVKKSMWRQTLETRWKKEAGFSEDMIKERILWMESLTPQQYLAMLSLGDVMVDPFPFGGGVTTLEALAVCTPVITLPTHQNVPALTAGMLRTLAPGDETSVHVDHIYSSVDDFIKGARRLLTDSTASVEARRAICRDVHNLYVDSNRTNPTVAEWAELIVTTSTPNAEEVMITPDANITSVGDSDSE